MFLSYAREDIEAARRIAGALISYGVEVWFDQSELVGGDQWDAKACGQIGSCALFVPVISANTQARREGYFRLEWKLAAQRTHMISGRTPFLLPVVLDATRDAAADVPGEFRAVQWTRLVDGEVTPAFGARVKNLLGAEGAPVSDQRLEGPQMIDADQRPTRLQRSIPLWVWGALAVVAFGAWMFLPRTKPANATPKPQPAATSPSAAAKPPLDLANAKSIAVLPFENRSADKKNAYFTGGIHEDILTNLAHISELRVISRTSVMEYRDTTKKMPEIGRELNVAWLLEGSAKRAGNLVHITSQYIATNFFGHGTVNPKANESDV